jgi:cell division checkpoint GTPase YihA
MKENEVIGSVQNFSALKNDGVDTLRLKLAEWLMLEPPADKKASA